MSDLHPALDGWTRSSFCSVGGCLEVSTEAGQVQIRDSKTPNAVVTASLEDWAAFIAGVRNGEFDVAGVDQ